MEKLTSLFNQLNEELVAHPVTQSIWSFYTSRSALHQLIIRTGLFVLCVILICILLIFPLANFASRAQENFKIANDNLIWMQNHEKLAKIVAANQLKSVEVIVRESAISPYITRLTANGEMTLSFELSEVPFNQLAEVLIVLSRDNGITVSSATISRLTNRSGYVSATLVMGRN